MSSEGLSSQLVQLRPPMACDATVLSSSSSLLFKPSDLIVMVALIRREKIVSTISLLLLHVRSPHYTNLYELHGVYSQTLLACTDRL